MLATRRRKTTAAVGVVGLLAGALAMVPSSSVAVPAVPNEKSGSIQTWGYSSVDGTAVNTTRPASEGPWAAVTQGRNATFGLTYTGTVRRLAGEVAYLDVPADVAAAKVTAVSTGVTFAAAVKTDGSVSLWGSARGIPLAPLSVADLGGKAVDVSVGSFVMIRLEDGRVRTLTSFGVEPLKTEDGVEVSGASEVYASGAVGFARLAGGGLVGYSVSGDPVLFPASLAGDQLEDPVVSVAFGGYSAVAATQSGDVYVFEPGSGEPDSSTETVFPADEVDGRVVDVATASNYYAARTDENEVVVWGVSPSAPDYAAMATIPEELAGQDIADLVSGAETFAAVVTAPLPDLAVDNNPTVSGKPEVGSTLTGTSASFTGGPDSVTNQWFAGDEPIAGATGTSLTLTAAQLGKIITLQSTALRGDDSLVSPKSIPVGPVTAIVKAASATTLSAPHSAYGATGRVTVSVSNASGRPVTGTVTLSGAGATQRVNVVGGRATFSLAKSLAAKAYTLTATYSGSTVLHPSSRQVRHTVTKGKTKRPAYKANKAPTSKKKGKATITVARNAGLANASGKVTVTLKKGKSTKKVNATLKSGKRSISLPKLAKGTWKVSVTYRGDKNYVSQKSKTYTLKIKK